MSNVRLIIAIVIANLVTVSPAFSQNTGEEVLTKEYGTKYTIHSTILNEHRTLLVQVPTGYSASEASYSVIYILDAESWFEHAVSSSQFLQRNNRIPANIVVGIPNNTNPFTRNRDMSEQSEQFTKFIREEVFRFVADNFRVTSHKTAFGHSASGSYLINAISSDPRLFDNYIMASPGIDEDSIRQLETVLSENSDGEISIYLTLTNKSEDGEERHRKKDQLMQVLEKESVSDIRWQYDFIPNVSHFTTPFPTLFEGMAFSFYDYTPTRFANYQDYIDFGGIREIEKHYAERGEKYSVSPLVFPRTIVELTSMLLDSQQNEEARNILADYALKYPEDLSIYRNQSIAFLNLGQLDEAISAYERVVAIAKLQGSPFLERYELRLAELSEQLRLN